MATRSFTDTYTLTASQSRKLKSIIEESSLSSNKGVNVKKIQNHKDVKGKAIISFLGLNRVENV